MVNKRFWLGIAALVFGMMVVGCKTASPINEDNGGSAFAVLNGTWDGVSVDGRSVSGTFEITHNNGTWESSFNGIPQLRATYTISGDKFIQQVTHAYGGSNSLYLNNLGLAPQWYTKDQIKGSDVDTLFIQNTLTYSLSGNTLTVTHGSGTTTIYTRK